MAECKELRIKNWIFANEESGERFFNTLALAELSHIKNYDLSDEPCIKLSGEIDGNPCEIKVDAMSVYPRENTILVTSNSEFISLKLDETLEKLADIFW